MSNEPNKPIDPPTPDNIRSWHPEISYALACAVRYELENQIYRGKLRDAGQVIDAVPVILAAWAKECVAATRNGPRWRDQSGAASDRVRDAVLSWADELEASPEHIVGPFIAAEVRRRVAQAETPPDVTSGVGAVVGPDDRPTTIRQATVSGAGTVGVEIG